MERREKSGCVGEKHPIYEGGFVSTSKGFDLTSRFSRSFFTLVAPLLAFGTSTHYAQNNCPRSQGTTGPRLVADNRSSCLGLKTTPTRLAPSTHQHDNSFRRETLHHTTSQSVFVSMPFRHHLCYHKGYNETPTVAETDLQGVYHDRDPS
jgi:hypothetical protein